MSKADSYVDIVPQLKRSHVLTLALATALATAIYNLPAQYENYSLTGPRAPNKQFKNFEQFFPFYLSEHKDLANRRLHLIGTTFSIVLMIANPILMLALTAACSAGYLVCNLVAGMPHGLVEGAVMVGTYLFLVTINGSLKTGMSILLLGYSFAWVGHFFFEHNKPATFIYPSYSLMGDFRMWFEAVRGTIPGIWTK